MTATITPELSEAERQAVKDTDPAVKAAWDCRKNGV
jgi:hypothetical protein